jgi:acetyl esterase/lipase
MVLAALVLASLGQVAPQTVTYRTIGNVALQMDIYRPSGAVKVGGTPAVILIHGGAWISGARQDMGGFGTEFANRGILAATVTYRLGDMNPAAPNNYWPMMIDDVQSAVRFLRANAKTYNIDTTRFGAAGVSAGAQLSMLLGTTDTRDVQTTFYPALSSRVKAVVDIVGPTNFNYPIPANVEAMIYPWVTGKPKAQSAVEMISMSPQNFVDSKTAPMFIVHGMNDSVVPVIHATNMKATLQAKGIPVQMVLIPGADHDLNAPGAYEALFQSIDWMAAQLKGSGTSR